MISEDLRNKMVELMKSNPQEAIKELQNDPKLLEILLHDVSELKKTKEELNNERTKYVNITSRMQQDLRDQAVRLNTTQGLLIGAGILLLLRLLDES